MTGHPLSQDTLIAIFIGIVVAFNVLVAPFFAFRKMRGGFKIIGGTDARVSIKMPGGAGPEGENIHYDIDHARLIRALVLRAQNAPIGDICRALHDDYAGWDAAHKQAFEQGADVMLDRFNSLMQNPLVRKALSRMQEKSGMLQGGVSGIAAPRPSKPSSGDDVFQTIKPVAHSDAEDYGPQDDVSTKFGPLDAEAIERARTLKGDGAGIEDICRDINDRYIWWQPDERARYRAMVQRAIG
ncbi:MAG: hypothetical protein GC185_10635 [Alphaproteobacteria bacterium]|nr:hypothetical protein [Alphaproteobacteria bacterium]